MSDVRRVVRTVLIGALLALVAVVLVPRIATASTDSGRLEVNMSDGAGFTVHPQGALIDTTRLAPGRTATGTMGVRNGSDDLADLSLKITDVSDIDNGCAHAERVVDPTCGSGIGQMGGELIFTVAVSDTEAGPFAQIWSGNVAQLEHGIAATQRMAAHTARWVRLTVALPMSSGDETQTDTFGFGVRVMLQTSFGVEGIQIGGGGVSTGAQGVSGQSVSDQGVFGLPFTGVQAVLLIGAGALLLACGLLFIVLGSVRRRGKAG